MTILTPATTLHIPRAWIGCLNCYNNGSLVGQWIDCTDIDDIDLDEIHTVDPRALSFDCEELWCFDYENIPVSGEMDPLHTAAWGEAYVDLDCDPLWPIYSAWVWSGMYVERADGPGNPSEFLERYCGHFNQFQEYAEFLVEETGLLRDSPESVSRYFDWEGYARDLEHDYTVIDAPTSGVYVFRDY